MKVGSGGLYVDGVATDVSSLSGKTVRDGVLGGCGVATMIVEILMKV